MPTLTTPAQQANKSKHTPCTKFCSCLRRTYNYLNAWGCCGFSRLRSKLFKNNHILTSSGLQQAGSILRVVSGTSKMNFRGQFCPGVPETSRTVHVRSALKTAPQCRRRQAPLRSGVKQPLTLREKGVHCFCSDLSPHHALSPALHSLQ